MLISYATPTSAGLFWFYYNYNFWQHVAINIIKSLSNYRMQHVAVLPPWNTALESLKKFFFLRTLFTKKLKH